jgi:uncharacterized membrane protein YukC
MDSLNWDSIKQKFSSDKRLKLYSYIGIGIIALIIILLGYRQLIWAPANEKANDGWWMALNYIEKDSTDQAINMMDMLVEKLVSFYSEPNT